MKRQFRARVLVVECSHEQDRQTLWSETQRIYTWRKSFEKISAVEGIRLTGDMRSTFRSLDKQGASAADRRKAIEKKYGK
jgi:hypothetical protein